jgi:hypothetical protein
LDKKWHEVRLVYRAQKAPAATYVMFKFRPTADKDLPEEANAVNNRLFSQLVADHFFTKEGKLDPDLIKDRGAHGKKVAAFVTAVLTHKGDKKWIQGTFLGLPSEARLGGGSRKESDGKFSGDGWAWNVMKFQYSADSKSLALHNVPIKGFATDVKAKQGKWAMACAQRFTDKGDARLAKLCRESGHVDLPAGPDGFSEADDAGEVASSKMDAANMFRKYKGEHMVETVPLRDPRRDLFEEKGMTCSQCHVRKFGARDMYDPAAYDSSAGAPTRLNKRQAATFFVITPTERWQPYAIDFQHKQECKFKVALENDIGLKTNLACPLKAQ